MKSTKVKDKYGIRFIRKYGLKEYLNITLNISVKVGLLIFLLPYIYKFVAGFVEFALSHGGGIFR